MIISGYETEVILIFFLSFAVFWGFSSVSMFNVFYIILLFLI